MQLRLTSSKTAKKKKKNEKQTESWKFQIHKLRNISAIKKTLNVVGGERGKFVLFWSLFLSGYINFQYKLNSHKSFFIVTVT